jgi:diguanylate cyclase (GGDEF)-like protein/PAS domain S-box-containing protein
MNPAAVAAAVLQVGRGIAAARSVEEVAAEVSRLPAACHGGGRLEFLPGTHEGPLPPDALQFPVITAAGPAGRLLVTDADASAARVILPAVAELVATALDGIRAVEEQEATTRTLRHDRAYFEQLFEASPEAIVVLDREDRVVRANREFEQLFGYTLAEAAGQTINELIVPDDLRENAVALTRDVAAGRSVATETLRRRKDGTLLQVSILGTPVVVEGNQVAVYGIYRDITAQKESEEALRRLSTTDDLTGLYNRRGFFLLAEQQRRIAVRRKAELLLLYIDIDDFKVINDMYGHVEGDRVLARLGDLLRSCYRDSDIVGRLDEESRNVLARVGGDEFVILALDAGAQGDEILVKRLEDRMRVFNEEHGRPYVVSLSVGAVRITPGPEVTVDSLIAEADRLMYDSKRGRRRI